MGLIVRYPVYQMRAGRWVSTVCFAHQNQVQFIGLFQFRTRFLLTEELELWSACCWRFAILFRVFPKSLSLDKMLLTYCRSFLNKGKMLQLLLFLFIPQIIYKNEYGLIVRLFYIIQNTLVPVIIHEYQIFCILLYLCCEALQRQKRHSLSLAPHKRTQMR